MFNRLTRLSKTTPIIFALLTLSLGSAARADDCSVTLQPLHDWFNSHPNGYVPFTMVATRNDNAFASYTSGGLRQFLAVFPPHPELRIDYLYTDDAPQTFSGRYAPCPGIGCSPFPYGQNFYIGAADSLAVNIFWNGRVAIHLNTWGSDVGFDGFCIGNMIFGYINNDSGVMISFGQPALPPPQP